MPPWPPMPPQTSFPLLIQYLNNVGFFLFILLFMFRHRAVTEWFPPISFINRNIFSSNSLSLLTLRSWKWLVLFTHNSHCCMPFIYFQSTVTFFPFHYLQLCLLTIVRLEKPPYRQKSALTRAMWVGSAPSVRVSAQIRVTLASAPEPIALRYIWAGH